MHLLIFCSQLFSNGFEKIYCYIVAQLYKCRIPKNISLRYLFTSASLLAGNYDSNFRGRERGDSLKQGLINVVAVESGEISLWDTVDGQCLESKRMAQVHTSMQAYRYSHSVLCSFQ